MRPATEEWVNKAEGDYATAKRELRARRKTNYDAVCFHSQQCAEKYFKALLQEADIRFGKTHNLVELLDHAMTLDSSLDRYREDATALTAMVTRFRYPGDSATKDIAKDAVRRCERIRQTIRVSLDLVNDSESEKGRLF